MGWQGKPTLAQDLKCIQCELEDMLEMMLENEWSCTLFEIIFWSRFAPFSTSCSNMDKHVIAIGGKNFQHNLMCIWKGSELELLASMASNKNGCESSKNLKVMINIINAQLPKKITSSMVFVEIKCILPLEMGNITCQCTKGAFKHSKQFGPESLSQTCMRVKSKETSSCWKLKRGEKAWNK